MMKKRRRNGSQQVALFVQQARAPRMVLDPAMRAAVVDALAELLLEAARPTRAPLRSAGGQDDESQDHG